MPRLADLSTLPLYTVLISSKRNSDICTVMIKTPPLNSTIAIMLRANQPLHGVTLDRKMTPDRYDFHGYVRPWRGLLQRLQECDQVAKLSFGHGFVQFLGHD